LAAVVGEPQIKPARLSGSLEENLPELTWDEAWQQLLARSPELARVRAGVARARCDVALQCAKRVPNVDFLVGVQRDNATRDNVARLEVGLPLPLFNRNQGNIAQSQAELVVAENEVRRVELDLQERLAAALERYRNARQEVATYRDGILPDARASLELVRTGYQTGEVSYLVLLTAQRTYFNAEVTCLESLRQLRTISVAIRGLLLGGGSGGDAGRPPSEPTRLGDLQAGQNRAIR
jgi:cobalt-zinc-cadmium efflux system outer membrane protein